MENKLKMLDKRVYGRFVEKGLVKPAELQQHIKNLPDDAANATWVQIDLDDAEISDDAGEDETEEMQ